MHTSGALIPLLGFIGGNICQSSGIFKKFHEKPTQESSWGIKVLKGETAATEANQILCSPLTISTQRAEPTIGKEVESPPQRNNVRDNTTSNKIEAVPFSFSFLPSYTHGLRVTRLMLIIRTFKRALSLSYVT